MRGPVRRLSACPGADAEKARATAGPRRLPGRSWQGRGGGTQLPRKCRAAILRHRPRGRVRQARSALRAGHRLPARALRAVGRQQEALLTADRSGRAAVAVKAHGVGAGRPDVGQRKGSLQTRPGRSDGRVERRLAGPVRGTGRARALLPYRQDRFTAQSSTSSPEALPAVPRRRAPVPIAQGYRRCAPAAAGRHAGASREYPALSVRSRRSEAAD